MPADLLLVCMTFFLFFVCVCAPGPLTFAELWQLALAAQGCVTHLLRQFHLDAEGPITLNEVSTKVMDLIVMLLTGGKCQVFFYQFFVLLVVLMPLAAFLQKFGDWPVDPVLSTVSSLILLFILQSTLTAKCAKKTE